MPSNDETISPQPSKGAAGDPHGPARRARYREVTVSAILFGVIFGAIMNAAITYAGLKIGFTIGGSAIAAVLGFGVLRGLLRRGSILEVNIGQTIASAVNVPNSGVIFTVPVLFLLGWSIGPGDLDFWLITLACVAGALLGCAFIIPLRKQMIEVDRLRFPSATGVATVLKSPGAGAGKSIVLVAGILTAMLVFAPASLPDLGLPGYASLEWRLGAPSGVGEPTIVSLDGRESVPVWRDEAGASQLPLHVDRDGDGRPDVILSKDRLDVGRLLGFPGDIQLIFAIAPFAIGAGFLSGRAGLMVLAGGLLAYFVLNPLVARTGLAPPALAPHQIPDFAFSAINRPLGIGLLLGGALMGVVASLPAIRAALVSIARAGKVQRSSSGPLKTASDEMSLRTLVFAVLGALVLLFVAADFLASAPFNPRCPITAAATAGTEGHPAGVTTASAPSAVTLPPGTARAPIDPAIEPAPWRGYAVGFATEDARQTWTTLWSDTERDAFMEASSARPGWLSGLPLHLRSLLLALIGAAWIWFAGIIIAQCTGMTDWSPISGMALLTVVLVLVLAGSGAVLGAILIGAALCVAITVAADMMADLKTGHLVGAVPRRQQIVEMLFAGIGPVITMLVLLVITQVNLTQTGIPIGPGTDTTAPQAQALQAVISGVQGGEMPYALYGFGALLGILLGLGSFAGLGVLIGLSIYLPFFYIATYGIGCVIQIILVRIKGARWCENWGVPFAAGLIVGEAILALVVNVLVLLKGLGGGGAG
jgi:uncharacterized oligopeptide transporter (OPT) family protein